MSRLTDGATKKSLFIQVRNYPYALLEAHLEHVRTHHRDPSKDDYIHNVVLDEIGAGSLSTNIATILPYLPGGERKSFDNVFVGSHFVPWTGEGSAYNHGMRDSGHRWANLFAQRDLWERFAAIAPGPWHGYINHEGVLDWLDDGWLNDCYEAYLIQSRRDLDAVAGPNRALLWSPAIWGGVPLSPAEESGIRHLFRRVKTIAPPGVTWLHLQDMLGRGRADITKEDVRQWYREIAAAHRFDSLRVNIELFRKDAAGGLVPVPTAELAALENWYQAQGIPVGASFELRYWMQAHTEL